MNEKLFSQVVAAVADVDRLDLIKRIGALQLHPKNLSHTIRLELLAHAIVSEEMKPGLPFISTQRFRGLCDEPPVGSFDVVRYEDPPEFMFTEPLSWRGRRYTVFPGISDDATFAIRHLAEALEVGNPSLASGPLAAGCRVVEAALVLSSEIARRAGLGRSVEPSVANGDVTVIPQREQLLRSKSAVSFTEAELNELLAAQGGIVALGDLISEFGVKPKGYITRKGRLLGRPIVKSGNAFVVALPGMLLESTRFHLVSAGIAAGLHVELGRRYCHMVWRTLHASLRRLNMSLTFDGGPFDFEKIPNSGEAIYQHDVDKFTQVMLITDPLADHDQVNVFEDWRLHDSQKLIQERLIEIAERFLKRRPTDQLLTLVVVQGAGHFHHFALEKAPAGRFLTMRVAELEQISFVEGGESLALWKYAVAREKANGRATIQSTSQLDEFELYRDHRHSYYVSDERIDLIAVEVGTGLGLRRKVVDRYDPLDEVIDGGKGTTQILRSLDDGLPVYADLGRVGKVAAVYVDGLGLRTWVRGANYGDDDRHRALHGPYAQIASGIGYWLWQFTPSLLKPLETLANTEPELVIRIELALDLLDSAAQRRNEPPFAVNSEDGKPVMHLRIAASSIPLFSTADNTGERELMRAILAALATVDGVAGLTPDNITQMVDAHAPLGRKKQFFFMNIDRTPELDEADLPSVRTLQEGDVDGLLDDLGEFLRTQEGIPFGPVKQDDRHSLLNKIVAYFYRLLSDEVSTLKCDGLLQQLMVRHESLIHDSTLRSMTIATRLACFGESPHMLGIIREEMPRFAQAKIASRFLVEFVASTPPSGRRELSLAAYDKLLAISHHIVNFGFSSDLLHLELADTGLAILKSGRLGVERDEFQEGLKAYIGALSADVISRSTRNFEAYWLRSAEGEGSVTLAEMEEGTRAEFGATLAEYFDLMTAALEIPRLARTSLATMPRDELIASLNRKLNWTTEKLSGMLEMLTLSRRDDFLKPPAPFRSSDVYPWKFSREFSYLRRPFVVTVVDGTPMIHWAFRHMFQAAGYLGAICASGRFLARTPEMKSLVSSLSDRRGRQFNDKVADVLEANEALIVHRRVKKIGVVTIPQQLGDIDVLAIDASTRTVTAIECKDLALARTPDELSNQLDSLIEPAAEGAPRAVKRHARRVDWLRERIHDLVHEYRLEDGDWQVTGKFVVDEPLFIPFLRNIGMEVLALETVLQQRRA